MGGKIIKRSLGTFLNKSQQNIEMHAGKISTVAAITIVEQAANPDLDVKLGLYKPKAPTKKKSTN